MWCKGYDDSLNSWVSPPSDDYHLVKEAVEKTGWCWRGLKLRLVWGNQLGISPWQDARMSRRRPWGESLLP